jgi:hypothetical protein
VSKSGNVSIITTGDPKKDVFDKPTSPLLERQKYIIDDKNLYKKEKLALIANF